MWQKYMLQQVKIMAVLPLGQMMFGLNLLHNKL
uniref:Uncharacterized protein n=1 Tax=Neisseria meningitidis alpha522 TaxID=996307 RepID=I4E635_NEIME|nr:hypothetical protein NMALPHA522_1260 [Neisseria meningitidis alpha522]